MAIYYGHLVSLSFTKLKDCLTHVNRHAALGDWGLTKVMREAIAGQLPALKQVMGLMEDNGVLDLRDLTIFVWRQYQHSLAASSVPLTQVLALLPVLQQRASHHKQLVVQACNLSAARPLGTV